MQIGQKILKFENNGFLYFLNRLLQVPVIAGKFRDYILAITNCYEVDLMQAECMINLSRWWGRVSQ